MTDIEERLRQLEDTLTNTESVLQREKASMPNSDDNTSGTESGSGIKCFPYVYIIGVVIPLITAAALYFAKPKWVSKKDKGKQVVCMTSLLKWTLIISVIGWVGLYLVNYCGAFSGAAVCFGGK